MIARVEERKRLESIEPTDEEFAEWDKMMRAELKQEVEDYYAQIISQWENYIPGTPLKRNYDLIPGRYTEEKPLDENQKAGTLEDLYRERDRALAVLDQTPVPASTITYDTFTRIFQRKAGEGIFRYGPEMKFYLKFRDQFFKGFDTTTEKYIFEGKSKF